MDDATERPLPPQSSQLPKHSRRWFLGAAAVGVGAALAKTFLRSRPPVEQVANIGVVSAAAVPTVPAAKTERKVPEALANSLASALGRGWVRDLTSTEGAAANAPEVWENAARKGLELCSMLYENKQQIAAMASEAFPQTKLDPKVFNYYDCLAVRRTRLDSCDLALYLAILATEDSKEMKSANCYVGNNVRVSLDPNSAPKEGEYDSDKAAIWRMENFFLGVRAMQGLYVTPAGNGIGAFDLTAKGLNMQLLKTYNVNPLWEKRVVSFYKQIEEASKNTPGLKYLTENIISGSRSTR